MKTYGKKLTALLGIPKSAVHNDIVHNDTSLPIQFYCSVSKKNLAVLLAVKDNAAVLPVLVSAGTIHSFVIDSRDGRCLCQNQLTAHCADIEKRNDVVAHPGNLQSNYSALIWEEPSTRGNGSSVTFRTELSRFSTAYRMVLRISYASLLL